MFDFDVHISRMENEYWFTKFSTSPNYWRKILLWLHLFIISPFSCYYLLFANRHFLIIIVLVFQMHKSFAICVLRASAFSPLFCRPHFQQSCYQVWSNAVQVDSTHRFLISAGLYPCSTKVTEVWGNLEGGGDGFPNFGGARTFAHH